MAHKHKESKNDSESHVALVAGLCLFPVHEGNISMIRDVQGTIIQEV